MIAMRFYTSRRRCCVASWRGSLLAPAVAPGRRVDQAPPRGDAGADAKPQPKAPQRGSALPKTPAEREKTLSDLYALLATADDEDTAKAIADAIERVWLHSGSATIDLLMERSIKAMSDKKIRPGPEAARPRGRAGARLHRGLEPPRLRALRAEATSSARWATCGARWRSIPTTSRRSTGSARSCARSARRSRRSRPSSSCSTCTPTGRAPSRPSRSSSARSTARASDRAACLRLPAPAPSPLVERTRGRDLQPRSSRAQLVVTLRGAAVSHLAELVTVRLFCPSLA